MAPRYSPWPAFTAFQAMWFPPPRLTEGRVALHKGHTYRVISIIRDRRRAEQWSGIRSTVRTAMRFRNWIFRPLLTGIDTWSGDYTSTIYPSGRKGKWTFSTDWTFVEADSFLATTTYVSSGGTDSVCPTEF